MIFFPRHRITIYRYVSGDSMDAYDTPRLEFIELGTFKCDFQVFTTPLDEFEGYGLVDTGLVKVYVDGDVTSELRLWGDCFFILDDEPDVRYVMLSRPHHYRTLNYTLIVGRPDIDVEGRLG